MYCLSVFIQKSLPVAIFIREVLQYIFLFWLGEGVLLFEGEGGENLCCQGHFYETIMRASPCCVYSKDERYWEEI